MIFELLELAGNKALEYDPESQRRLAKLQGKSMRLHLRPMDQNITLTPQAHGLELSSSDLGEVDVTLSTTLTAMIKITRDGIEDADLEPGELEMRGDPIIGQRFAQVISDLNIDWEQLLSEQIGHAPAKAVTMVAKQTRSFAEESRDKIKELVSVMVKDELNLAPDKIEVDKFLDDVDDLRANVDRLKARVDSLLKLS